MHSVEDSLREIPQDCVEKLREKYKEFLPSSVCTYNFLGCVLKWRSLRPEAKYATLLAPDGDWEGGTFVAVQKWCGYDVFLGSLDSNGSQLHDALINTKQIDWMKLIVLYAVQKDLFPAVLRALNAVEFPMHHYNFYDVWWMPKENALNLETNECPPEVCVKRLDSHHAEVINSYWESRFPNSEEYLRTFIELNGGYGVFLKACGKLVSWILNNQIGLGALETLGEHRKKGYASLVVKHLAKSIAESGQDPACTVLQSNEGSGALFRKLGFVVVQSVVFVESEIQR